MTQMFFSAINMSLSASVIAVLVIVLRLVLKKVPKSAILFLWGIVGIRLLLPFSFESPLSLMPRALVEGKTVGDMKETYLEEVSIIKDNSVYYDAAVSAGREPVFDGEEGYYVVTAYDQLGEPSTVENTIAPILSYAWGIGVLAFGAYTIFSYFRLSKSLKTSILLTDNVYVSHRISSPFVFGFISPRIYLPSEIDEKSLTYVIAHEEAHIKRKDHIWKLLGYSFLVFYWFNPVMWLSYSLFCRDIELACDERAVRELTIDERAEYSKSLLDCTVRKYSFTACPLAFGEVGVKERIKTVMNYKRPAFVLILLSVIVCVVTAVCFLTNPLKNEDILTVILEENGYEIVEQEDEEITLSVPLSELSEKIFTKEGLTYKKGDVISYKNDTTAISLVSARISNEGDEYVYFFFDFEYDLPENSGDFLSARLVKDGGVWSNNIKMTNKSLYDSNNVFENAVLVRGEGPDSVIAFYVSSDALRKAEKFVNFDISLNKITYKKEGVAIENEEADDNASIVEKDEKSFNELSNAERFPTIDEQVIFYANGIASEYTYDYSVGTSLGTIMKLEKVYSAKMTDADEVSLYYMEYYYTPTLALPGETDNYEIYKFYFSVIHTEDNSCIPLDYYIADEFFKSFGSDAMKDTYKNEFNAAVNETYKDYQMSR